MVRFEPQDDAGERTDAGLAPVTYLHGAAPGMKRRSPLKVDSVEGDSVGVDSVGGDSADGDSVGGDSAEVDRFTAAAASKAAADTETDTKADTAAGAVPADLAPGADDDDSFSPADALDQRERAEKVLLHRLRGRSLSTVEALLVLNATGVDSGEASEIIAKFIELGYLDETKLADQIIHSHNVRKGLGRTGVEAEMRRRKLDPSVMMDKLEELPDDEAERAIELATKRIGQMERFDDQTIDRRLTGFLMRKGYSSSAVRLAVKAAMDSRGGGGASRVRFR